ncbi:MAG TPA: hypothetical protein VIH31_02050 [Candidatus Paceibacterota bacterium]
MRKFTLFLRGPLKRRLLSVSLDGNHLKISGHSPLIVSLEKEGVTELSTGQHYELKADLWSMEAPTIFEALKSRFSRDSAYEIYDSPTPTA